MRSAAFRPLSRATFATAPTAPSRQSIRQAAPNIGRHIRLSREVSDLITDLDLNDPRLYALWMISAATGDGDSFEPSGEYQLTLLSTLGLGARAVEPEVVLNDLVLAGVLDLCQARSADLQQATAS